MKTDLPLRERPQRWWLMVLLTAAMLVCYVHRGALSVAAPFMIKDLGISKERMGVLLSAFFWSYALMQIPAGWLVDHFGVKWSYAAGYAIWLTASALTGFARNLAGLITARMAVGVGQSVAFPGSARAVANWFKDQERGAVTACYMTGVRLGQAVISRFGPFLLLSHGLPFFFFVTGILPVLWLWPWLRFLGRWETRFAPDKVLKPEAAPRRSLSFMESLALFEHRSVLGIFLGFFAYDYTWFVYVTWLPGYLVLERQFSPREMSIYSSVPYIAMSVIILLSGFMSDALVRRGYPETTVRKTFVMIGLGLSCLIVPAGLVEDKMTAVWLLMLSMCGLGVASANTWTLTQSVCSKSIVGTVTGIQNFGGNLGGVLAPILTGYIADRTNSFALAMSLTGAILVAGILAYGFLVYEKVEQEPSS